ncbi:MAG: ATP-binding protein [bacterium]
MEPSGIKAAGTFVGRGQELEALLDGLTDAFAGRGRLFLVSGEPGIGKSRLADEFAARARERGAVVLWGRCWEAGGAPAFWPWVQSIRAYLRHQSRDVIREQLAAGAADLAQMLPELRMLLPDVVAPPSVDPDGARFRLFDATTTFFRNAAAQQSLVLVLDDLHAADASSLLLLRFVARELAEIPLLIVGAYRDLEVGPDHPLSETLSQLMREQATRLLPLTGLSRPEAARLIEIAAGATPPEALVAALHAQTDGNPLFMGEVVRFLAHEGRLPDEPSPGLVRLAIPQEVRDVIGRRIAQLSEECGSLLTLASVLGREFHLEALKRISALRTDEMLALLDQASAARLVVDIPGAVGRLRFAHALMRESLYESIPRARRVTLHRQAGEVLESLYAPELEPHLAELAHHFLEAAPGGATDAALTYARRAAERATSLLAYEEAVRLYQMAIQILDAPGAGDQRSRCDLLLALGDAQMRTGDTPTAQETFLQAAALAREASLPEYLARAALGYGGRFVWERGDRRLPPLLEDALAHLPGVDSVLRARLLARLAGGPLRHEPSGERRAALSLQALEMARRLGDAATLAYALECRAIAIWSPRNPHERRTLGAELIRVAGPAGDKEREFQGHSIRYATLLELGDMPGVHAEQAAMERLADELRQPSHQWFAAVKSAGLALLAGRLDEAERRIERALALGERGGQRFAVPAFRLQTYMLRQQQGRLAEIEEAVRRSVDEYPSFTIWRSVLAHLQAELGRRASARQAFEQVAGDNFGSFPEDEVWSLSLSFLAEVAAFLGDRERAATLYQLLLPYAAQNTLSAPEGSTGSISRPLGILASTLQRWDEAAGHFQEALQMNEHIGAPSWMARTQYDYARMLLARDGPEDRGRAADLLTLAGATSSELDLHALSNRISPILEQLRGVAARPSAPAQDAAVISGEFRREGEYWSISYGTESFRLKDSKGLRYIARLLGEPGREFHSLDLVAAEAQQEALPARSPGERLDALGLHAGLGDAGALLDPQAKAAYRRRLDELEDDLQEAEAWNDPERAARIREEKGFLARELAAAVGIGGRDRRAASASERARVSVTRAIKGALLRIGEQSPGLGRDLASTVKTGTYCSYRPDPRLPIAWRL